MGGKIGSRHLKRFAAPRGWPIHVKEAKWVFKPRPGPHPYNRCLPLSMVVRDILGFAKNAKEAKIILSDGKVKVDGKVRKDEKYPLGLMDVLEIEDAKVRYRTTPVRRKGLGLIEIDEKEASLKPCRIMDKAVVKGGHVQLNLHDGRNLLLKVKDPKKPQEDVYKPRDTLMINVPDQKIIKHIKFQEGAYVVITSGRNAGKHGKITEYVTGTATRPALASIQDKEGKVIRTTADYLLVLGEEEAEVKIAAG
jgi:small subunit ribosomal protein S4e